jgi:hypothetical protein
MQDLKIYILIEDREKESEVRIDGNFETLRELFYVICTKFADRNLGAIQADDLKHKQGETNVTD